MSTFHAFQSKYVKSWALIVGINKYKHVGPLGYAKNDAKAIAKLLREKFGFPSENVVELIDEQATAASIRKNFMAFSDCSRISADDRVLVPAMVTPSLVLAAKSAFFYLMTQRFLR